MAFTYSRAFSRRSARRAVSAVTAITMLAAQIAPWFLLSTAHAAAIITEVTGGTDISVDNALGGSAPAPTTLGDLVFTEQAMWDITTGDIVIAAPAGFEFENDPGNPATVTVDDADGSNNTSLAVSTPAPEADGTTTMTVTVSSNSLTTEEGRITISGIRIQPTGTAPTSGNLTLDASSTDNILTGVTEGVTSLGALSSIAGTIDHYTVRSGTDTDTLNATVGLDATVKIIPIDAYGNVTVGSATVTISATTGPSGATLSTTNADTQAGATTISDMTFDRVGVYELDVTDGSANSTGDAAYDLAVTVSAGALSAVDITPAFFTAGSDDDLAVTFVATNGIPNDGKIVLDLPVGYNAADVTLGSISADGMGNDPGVASAVASNNVGTNDRVTIVLDGTGDAITAGESIWFTLSSVRVPQVSGNPGNMTVTTTDSDDDAIDTLTTDPSGDDNITPGVIAIADVEPADLRVGEEGLVTISFTTINPLPADGTIDITFPTGFDLTGSANVDNETNIDGGFGISIAGQVATIERNGMGMAVPAGTAVSFTIDSIRNPLSAGMTDDYEIATKDISGVKIDEITNVSGDTVTPNNMSSTTVELADRQAGATTSASVTFTTTNDIPANGKIIIDFDSDFDLSGVGNGDISSSTLDGTFTVSENNGTLTITRAGGTDEAAGAHDIVIDGIVNPATAKNPTGGYGITTATAAGNEIDQEIGVSGTVIFGNLVSADVQPDSLVAGAAGDVVVTFTTEQPVPADGKIVITLPAGFALDSGSATAVTDGDSYNGTSYAAIGVVGQVVTLTGDASGMGIGAGETVTLTLSNIKNPTISGTTGTYSILTTDSSDAEIDADFAVAADTVTTGVLASVSVVPDSLTAGNTTSAIVSFTTANPVPANGKIVVVFPAGFDVSTVGMSDVMSGDIDGALAATVAGQTVTITRSGGSPLAAGSVIDNLEIQNVKNPGVSGTTGTYTVRTTNASNVQIDSTSGVAGSAIVAGSLDSANVQPVSLVAGATDDVTVTFTTSNVIPNNGKIVIDFPAGFDASAAAGVSISDNNGGTTEPTIASVSTIDGDGSDDIATITLAGNNTAIAAGSSVTLVISGVRNPQVSGSTGIYSITTTDSSDSAIDTVASVTADTITAGVLASTNVQPASLAAGATSVVTMSFTTVNPVPSTGKIEVTFPAGFSIANIQSADISSSSMDGSFTASVAGQVLTIVRSGGTAEPAGAQTISINNNKVRNPRVSGSTGTYGIATMTAGDADIDIAASVTADTVTIASITVAEYSQTNLGIGMDTQATFAFTTVNPIPADGVIFVRIPTDGAHDYDLSGVTNLDVSVYNSTQDEDLVVDSIDTSDIGEPNGVWITLDGSQGADAGDSIVVTVSEVVNPSVATDTAMGAIRTYLADATTGIDDVSNLTGVSLAPILSETDVEPALLVPGATTSLAVEFKLNEALPADGKITVTLPVGFDVSDADTLYAVSGMDGTFALSADAGTRKLTVTRQNDGTQTNAGTRVKFSVSHIVNPSSAGSTGLYSIRTTTSTNTLIELDDAVFADTLSLSNDIVAPVFTLAPYAYDITEATAKVRFTSNESGTYALSTGTGVSYLSETASGSMSAGVLASADIAGLSADTLYYFELTVEDAAGNVSTSGGSFRTNAYDAPEVSGFAFSGITSTGVTLSWANDTTGFTSAYRLSTSSTLSGAAWVAVTPSGTGASASMSGLTAATAYYVQVRNVKNGLTTVSPIYTFTTSSADNGVAVRSIVVMKNFGTADDTYMNGWQFRFNITVNDENERYMKLKLADWLGAQSGSILTSSGNTLGVNPFAASYANEAAVTGPGVSLGTSYAAQTAAFELVDTDPNTGGIQATFDVFVKLPVSTAATSFTSSYGIKTGTTSTITD